MAINQGVGHPTNDMSQELAVSNKTPIRPPKGLTTDQKRIWREVLRESPHINTPEYRELLVVYVTSFDRYVKYSQRLDDEGPVVVGDDRIPRKNPMVEMVNKQGAAVISASTKLSLTYRSKKNDVAGNMRKQHALAAPAAPDKPRRTHRGRKVIPIA